jgi:hypothetical protein
MELRGDIRVCQHQGGSGARLDGKVNVSEPIVTLDKRNRLKMLKSLNQKVSGRLSPSFLGTHGHKSRRGMYRDLTHHVEVMEHGKPVSPPRKRQGQP